MADEFAAATLSDIAHARQHTLGDLPRRTAQRLPDKLAIVDPVSGGVETRLTFAELDAAVDRTAAALADAGLAKGDRLALLSHNGWPFAVLTFAAARAGVVLVPVNFMLGPDEIAFILDHSEARAFVVEDGLLDVGRKALDAAGVDVGVRAVVRLAAEPAPLPDGWVDVQAWVDHDGTPPAVPMADDDPVRMMFTSGTESRPKGALLSSKALISQYVSCIVDGEYAPSDVDLHTLPLYHCAQLDVFLCADVYLGATSVILPGPDPAAVFDAVATFGVDRFFAPPTVWIGLLRHPGFDDADLSTLAKGYYGASPMPVEVLKEIQRRLPEVRLWNFYGQTEMSPLATCLGPAEQLEFPGSAGRAALNVETRIVDPAGSSIEPLPAGEVGEIVHRSPHATLGYYRNEEKTAEAFQHGWFHSGDLGYLDDGGRLYVVDRKKDMIKTGGENVASREVEEALYELDGVAEVAVFAVDHPRWVEAVTAVVVAKEGATLTVDDVMAHSRTVLAGYKRPKFVVLAEALPKNPSGKILKRQLREEHAGLAADES